MTKITQETPLVDAAAAAEAAAAEAAAAAAEAAAAAAAAEAAAAEAAAAEAAAAATSDAQAPAPTAHIDPVEFPELVGSRLPNIATVHGGILHDPYTNTTYSSEPRMVVPSTWVNMQVQEQKLRIVQD